MIQLLKRLKIVIDNFMRRHGLGRWRSETSKCRKRLAPYCQGYGIDIGAGGDPIVPTAIIVDLPSPYTMVGKSFVQLGGDARDLRWFQDNALDYVYSSHVLEDFENPGAVLTEWLRVIKPGGRLVVYCPDQQRYLSYCRKHRRQPNPHHHHADFSLSFVLNCLPSDRKYEIEHQNAAVDDYSWELVLKVTDTASKFLTRQGYDKNNTQTNA
jgi:SAM-dependent methyltransferase